MNHADPFAEASLAAKLRVWPRFAAFIIIAISVAVLSGWTLEIESLKRVLPGLVAMNPVTAICFLALGAGLVALPRAGLARSWAVVPGVVGLAVLGRYLLGFDSGIDRLLFRSALATNVMAPTTACNFVLASSALWLIAARGGRCARAAQGLAVAVAMVSLLALTGYAYGVEKLYRLATFIAMAVHTALAFLLFASAVLALHPERGLMAQLCSARAGGVMLRRLLVPTTLVPLLLGWLILHGQRAGFFDQAFGFTIMVVAVIVFLIVMIWRSAVRLEVEDAGRATVELALREAQGSLEETVRQRTSALHQAVDGIRGELRVLAVASEEILASGSALAASATQTAASLSETTATVEEVRQTAQLADGRAGQVALSAQKAVAVSSAGTAATQAAVAGMQRIRSEMEAMRERMSELDEQTRAISEIVAAVDELAEQSNLLAVNAAIEAAAAGSHGKGFAVVAQEVKYLSGQSREATKRVRMILSQIQNAAGAALKSSAQATEVVETGAGEVAVAGQSILGLEASVGEAARASAEIAASSRQQLTGMNHVAEAMEQIKAASHDTVTEAQRLEDAARKLHELGQRLKQVAERHGGAGV